MEHERFDRLTRNLAHGLTRRGAIAVLTALTGVTLAASDDADARKKKQKHLQPGDITGPCPPPVPPGPPVGPPPRPSAEPAPGPTTSATPTRLSTPGTQLLRQAQYLRVALFRGQGLRW
jgi:hypothetical protein